MNKKELTIGYAIGVLACFLFHELIFDSKKECRYFDGIEMCRTIHYRNWEETK